MLEFFEVVKQVSEEMGIVQEVAAIMVIDSIISGNVTKPDNWEGREKDIIKSLKLLNETIAESA